MGRRWTRPPAPAVRRTAPRTASTGSTAFLRGAAPSVTTTSFVVMDCPTIPVAFRRDASEAAGVAGWTASRFSRMRTTFPALPCAAGCGAAENTPPVQPDARQPCSWRSCSWRSRSTTLSVEKALVAVATCRPSTRASNNLLPRPGAPLQVALPASVSGRAASAPCSSIIPPMPCPAGIAGACPGPACPAWLSSAAVIAVVMLASSLIRKDGQPTRLPVACRCQAVRPMQPSRSARRWLAGQ